MTLQVNHAKVTGAAADPNAIVDGPAWDANHTLTGTADATQLNANVVQAVTNDTNIQGSIASQNLTFSWGGTLAAARLNSNVVQAVTNDTNVTGTISAQTVTLGWTGTLAAGRLNSNVVQAVTNDTNVTGSISAQTITLGWTGTLANSRLSNMAAYTFKGNATGSAAAPQDFTIDGLTLKASPAASDELLIWDVAGSAIKKATVSSIGGSSGVSSLIGLTGAIGDQWGLAATGSNIGIATTNPPFGAGKAINAQLNASVASNILTIALKGNNGSDPSATNPVLIPFRDTTLANGDPVWVAVTGALSITTNATGATLGSSNNTPFRFWVVAFNNAGTVVLALINCSASGRIYPLVEYALQSTTGISGTATSAGVFYTPNGTTLTSKAFTILGYVEYSSGLTTAGTYATAPTTVQLAGPFTPRPGAIIQSNQFSETAQSTNATTTFSNTTTAVSITPTSSINLVAVQAAGSLGNTGSFYSLAQLSRGGSAVGQPVCISVTSGGDTGVCLQYTDSPGTTSSTTWTVQIKTSNASGTAQWNVSGPGVGSAISATEIMG